MLRAGLWCCCYVKHVTEFWKWSTLFWQACASSFLACSVVADSQLSFGNKLACLNFLKYWSVFLDVGCITSLKQCYTTQKFSIHLQIRTVDISLSWKHRNTMSTRNTVNCMLETCTAYMVFMEVCCWLKQFYTTSVSANIAAVPFHTLTLLCCCCRLWRRVFWRCSFVYLRWLFSKVRQQSFLKPDWNYSVPVF